MMISLSLSLSVSPPLFVCFGDSLLDLGFFFFFLIEMALKRGLSGVHRIRGGSGGSRSVLVVLIFFCVFAPLVFFVGRGVYIDSSNGMNSNATRIENIG